MKTTFQSGPRQEVLYIIKLNDERFINTFNATLHKQINTNDNEL